MNLLLLSSFSALSRRLRTVGLAFATAIAAFAADPSGTWTIQHESAEGRSLAATLKLELKNGRLTGTVGGGRLDPVAISDASFKDETATFTVKRTIGRFLRKKTFETRYSVRVEGDELKGSVTLTNREGAPRTVPFTARRSS